MCISSRGGLAEKNVWPGRACARARLFWNQSDLVIAFAAAVVAEVAGEPDARYPVDTRVAELSDDGSGTFSLRACLSCLLS